MVTGRFAFIALRPRALASLLLALERRRIAFHPKAQAARLWLAMMRLHQGFAPGEMGFNDKFALQKILNGPCPLWVLAVFNSGRALALNDREPFSYLN